MKRYIFAGIAVAFLSTPALADDENDIREATECLPAGDLIKYLSKFDGLKPEQRDTVDAIITARLDKTSGEMPERFYYRHGDQEIDFPIGTDGSIPDFPKVKHQSRKGELCFDDPSRAGMRKSESELEFDLDLEIRFLKASGLHTLDDLKDGANDGKSFYKKLVPRPMRFMVPKMTHVTLSYDDETTVPRVQAMKVGEPIEGLVMEPFGRAYVMSLEQIETLGADALSIGGGDYVLEPTPSIKKMKSLGFADEDDEESEDVPDDE